ncbi:unnamed protein product [Oikopleura dioica]|uniref:ZP domain-containing protein n=1 Tax=Oikopleura dioica TaxID=34765 RepID=E4X1X7_OIKDI|nr:unnamed protein product [Oikopleura dioica]
MEAECECFNGYESLEDRWSEGSGDDYACVLPCHKTIRDTEIICKTNRKVVKIPLCAIRENHIKPNHLFMGNDQCSGTVNAADGTIDFEDGVNNCSMTEWVNATHINYSGLIYSQQGGNPGSVFSYGHGLQLHHTCSFPKCIHVDLDINVNIAVLNLNLGATGEFTASVAVYDQPEMTSPVSHGKIFEGFDDVFVKIELDDTHDFLLSFQNCEAYDDSISSRPTWPLINDGFAEGAQILQNYDNSISFNFKAFAFQDFNPNGPPDFGEEIKIQCTVCVCDPNLDQNCIPGARRRRSIGEESKDFIVNTSFKRQLSTEIIFP